MLRRMTQELSGALGGAVGREGPIRLRLLDERSARPLAVHTRGRGEDEASHLRPRSLLKQHGGARQVHVAVLDGSFEAGSNARPRRQMHDRLWTELIEERTHAVGVSDVGLVDPGEARVLTRARQVRLLPFPRIEGVEGVEHGDAVGTLQAGFDQVGPDEACTTGDENSHRAWGGFCSRSRPTSASTMIRTSSVKEVRGLQPSS